MSFASETKKELTHMDVSDSDAKVELAAYSNEWCHLVFESISDNGCPNRECGHS